MYDNDPTISTVTLSLGRSVAGVQAPTTNVTVTIGSLVTLPDGTTGIAKATETKTVSVGPTTATDVVLTVPTAPFRITIVTETPFAPTDLGIPDPRQLGVRVAATYAGGVITR